MSSNEINALYSVCLFRGQYVGLSKMNQLSVYPGLWWALIQKMRGVLIFTPN